MDTERRLLKYLKPHYKTLAVGLVCAALVAATTAGTGWLIQQAINGMVQGRPGLLNTMCVLVLAVFLIKGIFSYGQSYLLSLVANRIATRLRDEIFAHLHSLSLAFFNRKRIGAIMSILTNDVPVVQNAAMSLRDVVSAPITIVVSLVALFWYSPTLALASLMFIPFMAVAISRIGKRIRKISGRIQGQIADVTTIIEETVAGARIVKSFAAEGHEVSRFHKQNNRTLLDVMTAARKSAQLRPIVDFIGAFGVALILYLGGNSVATTNEYQRRMQSEWIRRNATEILRNPETVNIPKLDKFPKPKGGLSEGDLIAFLYLLNAVARAAGDIGGIVTVRAQALAAAKRIFDEVLDVEPEVKEKPDAFALETFEGHITFDNVSFKYSPDDADNVLKDLSFEIKPGEVIALVGESGSGKSTLVDLIPRFYDPTGGRILVDGHDLRDVQIKSLRQKIGIVPQETLLFAGTLRDNIAYGNRDATDEQILSAVYSANAFFVERMEKGLETVLGERGVRISGGERQRIAIARAILMNPRLLILDEATSSLDASSEALVQEALDTLMKGRTTIVIAHRLSTIVNADKIMVMDKGRIVEVGTHRELIERGGMYALLYGMQKRRMEIDG